MPEDILNIKVIQKLIRINQRLLLACYYVLVIALVAGMPFAGVHLSSVKICANIGQPVKLLSYVGNNYTDASLYRENGTHIASWKDDNNEVAFVNPDYKGRIHMDGKRNIWILSVERPDDGRFYIKFGLYEQLGIELTVEEELTEEELQKCPKNHPDFPKEGFGVSHDTTTAKRQGDVAKDSSNSLTIGLLSAILIILIADKILASIFSENYIRRFSKHWIQERLFRQQLLPVNTSETTEESEALTADQVLAWLDRHPDFMKKYHDEIYNEYIRSTLAKYAVTLIDSTQADTGVEVNQTLGVPTQMSVIASEICNSQSSDSFSSGMQPFSKEEQLAIPEGVKAQTESLESYGQSIKEVLTSGDDSSVALLSKSFNQ